jgi:hypothetical protein
MATRVSPKTDDLRDLTSLPFEKFLNLGGETPHTLLTTQNPRPRGVEQPCHQAVRMSE